MEIPPKKIMVMGKTIDIKYVKKVDKQDSMGECNGPERLIKIRDSLQGEQLDDTILHEIIHQIIYLSGQGEHLTDEQEEGLVLAISTGLLPLIKLNLKDLSDLQEST